MTEAGTRTPARVTFVVDSSAYGGAETYVVRLLEHLPGWLERAVVTVTPVQEEIADAAGRLAVPLVAAEPVGGKFDLVRLVQQVKAVRGTRPDLIHVNLATVGHSRHVLAALALLRTPLVATLHSHVRINGGLQLRFLRAAYGRLARAIAVSEETRRQLCYDLRMSDDVVRIVPNGVAEHPGAPRRAGPTVRIGALGRLSPEKGLDVLIEATRRLDTGSVEVAIAGAGPERDVLERQAVGLPVALDGVVDAAAFLGGLDVFCLPSRVEGLPFALLEAMMTGLPCVATAVGGVPDALGPAGILVPPDDPDALAEALGELVDSPERRRSLGEVARARAVERFSIDRMVGETVAVYSEALAA